MESIKVSIPLDRITLPPDTYTDDVLEIHSIEEFDELFRTMCDPAELDDMDKLSASSEKCASPAQQWSKEIADAEQYVEEWPAAKLDVEHYPIVNQGRHQINWIGPPIDPRRKPGNEARKTMWLETVKYGDAAVENQEKTAPRNRDEEPWRHSQQSSRAIKPSKQRRRQRRLEAFLRTKVGQRN